NVELAISRKGHDEISELTNNFSHMINELSKNEYLHKDFVSNVSHEFKTPITAITGYAELLSSPALSNEKRLEYADVITRQSNRLAKLSSDLLRLSELENEQLTIKRETFRLDEQIRDAVLLLQNEWEQKDIAMDINLEQVPFIGDKALMYQVWINLIGNAIRYTGGEGKIRIMLHQSSNKVNVRIKDNGIGMTEEQMKRIFERFYRAEESRTTGGTGLGLPIAKRIIILHGGKIAVSSKPNNGTEFIVEFEHS
ncbi:MAG: HAMP domain-containing sensor histidine kinase, partial [bacterium]|nr:HAMP domain-containing sensor histidine kinase [bacterium]